MENSIGLLSSSKELIDDFRSSITGYEPRIYRSFDSIKLSDILVLCVDTGFFENTDGVQFHLSRIRKKLQGLPVLLVFKTTFLESLDFEWFFDEFILYPFRKGELEARLSGILQCNNIISDENIITAGNLKININEYTVYMNNIRQEFTYKEFELLRLFLDNRGVVFSRKDLLARIWGLDYIGGTRTVDVHIRRLRAKLGEEFNSIIETVRNVGYRCRV